MRSASAFLLVPACLMAQAPQAAPTPQETKAQLMQRMANDKLDTADDFLAAAQVMSESVKAEDQLAARELALVAWLKGKPNALVARSEDAFFRIINMPARFAVVGNVDTMPTDSFRLDFLMPPLAPMDDITAQQDKRLNPTWWARSEESPIHGLLSQTSGVPRSSPLGPILRSQLVKAYEENQIRTPEDLAATAKNFTRSEEISDLALANEMAALAAVRGDMVSRILFAQTWDRVAQGLGGPARYGTLGSQTMDPGVAPGVIRALGFSGRPTQR